MKFTPENGKITLAAKDIGDFVEICISDTGVGISSENIKKVFAIDEKFTSKGTNNEDGTGLGLILCKEFVEKNEGHICIESEIDKGSSFYFTLKKAQNTKNNMVNNVENILKQIKKFPIETEKSFCDEILRGTNKPVATFSIKEMTELPVRIKSVAQKYNFPVFINYSAILRQALSDFDIDTMVILQKALDDCIRKLYKN